jgi:nicotinic acid phosphoribosyltransferase
MSIFKRLGSIALASFIGVSAFGVGTSLIPGLPGFVSEAHAVVGRPLTPVSVAGATRRTVRRCAAGVYNC